MQLVLHAGAYVTDEDRLMRSLLDNRETLARNGVELSHPTAYRKPLRDLLQRASEGKAPKGDAETTLRSFCKINQNPRRVVFSVPDLFGTAKMAVGGGTLYPHAVDRLDSFRQVFPDHEVEFHLGLCNPATFFPRLLEQSHFMSMPDLLRGFEPEDFRWSELISRIRHSLPDLPITVWCNEDTPLIWSAVLYSLAGLEQTIDLQSEFAILKHIVAPNALKQFHSFIEARPDMDETQKRRIISVFLEKYALTDAIEDEIDQPNWDQARVERLTELYDEDISEICTIDGVQVIEP